MSAFTVILFAFDCVRVPVPARGAIMLAALAFFYLAQSKTAWATLPVAMMEGAGVILTARRFLATQAASTQMGHRPVALASLGVLGLAIKGLTVATLQRDAFLSLTDIASSLTGRTAIWRPLIQFYLDHSLLSAGYGAYWDASANLIDIYIANAGIWKDVDQGQNGYLDLLTQVGLPGLALACYAALCLACRLRRGDYRQAPAACGFSCGASYVLPHRELLWKQPACRRYNWQRLSSFRSRLCSLLRL